MRISELKAHLGKVEKIAFLTPSGAYVPSHFHVTEVGKITKHFIDCGGTERKAEVANLQLWSANDYDHRLHPEKILSILELSQKVLEMGDLEIEVEYQTDTIAKFGLDFNGSEFLLTTKKTDCLAIEQCGIPEKKAKVILSEFQTQSGNSCAPGSGCC